MELTEADCDRLRRDLEHDIDGILDRYPVFRRIKEVYRGNMTRLAAEQIVSELGYALDRSPEGMRPG